MWLFNYLTHLNHLSIRIWCGRLSCGQFTIANDTNKLFLQIEHPNYNKFKFLRTNEMSHTSLQMPMTCPSPVRLRRAALPLTRPRDARTAPALQGDGEGSRTLGRRRCLGDGRREAAREDGPRRRRDEARRR